MQDQPKKKILLVEDDVALAAVYRSRLELEDFETREVNNGEDALQAAKEFKPDLILLDAMMPKISGFDVLDILRNTPETANIRVIMLTALSQPKDKERAESLGVDDYLVKSQVVIGDVVERVKHHLNGTDQPPATTTLSSAVTPDVASTGQPNGNSGSNDNNDRASGFDGPSSTAEVGDNDDTLTPLPPATDDELADDTAPSASNDNQPGNNPPASPQGPVPPAFS